MKAYLLPLLAATWLVPAMAQSPLAGVSPEQLRAEQSALTLASAVDMAIARSADVQALTQEVAALEARQDQAGLIPDPALQYLREGDLDQAGSTTVQLAIPIELGGKRAARISVAQMEKRAAELDLTAARAALRAEVVATYHEVFLAQQRVALGALIGDAAKRSSEAAGRRVLAGKVSPVEESRAKVAEANVRIEMVEAQRELVEARIKLALLLGGRPQDFSVLAAPTTELPNLSKAGLEKLLAEAPAIKRALAEVDLRSSVVGVERAKRIPDISVVLGIKNVGIDPGTVRQRVFGLSVPLPLFDRNQGGIGEAEHRTEKARVELAGTRQRVRAEALIAYARLDAALDRERLIRDDVLPSAQFASEAAMKGLEAGKFSFLEVLDAQRTYVQAQSQLLRAIADAHRAHADLAKLIGVAAGADKKTHMQDTK